VLGFIFAPEISEGIKFLSLLLGQNLSVLQKALKGEIKMWFDVCVIIGAITFNICLFLVGLKVSKKKEVLRLTLLITLWYSLAGNAIICWLLPLVYLSDGLLWQELLKWSLRSAAIGLAAYYYLLPLFRGAVEPNQIAVRVFLWAKDRKDRVRKLESPGWYYYPSILFGFRKVSKEIEKVKVPISQILSRRAKQEMKEFEDRIMLDEAVLSVRYRITDLKKLVPHMGRKKAEDYIKDETTSLLRANIAIRNLDGTLEEWKAIEKAVKQGMLPLKNFGVTISTVLIHNLKVPGTENKTKETQEVQKEKQTTTSDDSEDKVADRVEPKKKGIAGVVFGVIILLIIGAIAIPIITNAIGNIDQKPRQAQQRVTEYKVQQTLITNGVRTLRIPANKRWVDMGIDLKGEKIFIVAKGIWDGSGSQAPETDLPCGPEGIRAPDWIDDMYNYPLSKNRTIHNLIGQIGGKVFHVGSNYQSVVKETGRLLLGINDYLVDDNSGYLNITIKIER